MIIFQNQYILGLAFFYSWAVFAQVPTEASFSQINFKSHEVKHKWGELMQLLYMSSEDHDDNMIVTHPLSWLKVNEDS